MDPDTLRLALQATNMMGTFALGIWLYLEKRGDKTNDRVSDLARKVEQIERDLSALQVLAENSPSHADLAKLYDLVNVVSGTVNQLVGENRGQSDILRMILNKIAERGMK